MPDGVTDLADLADLLVEAATLKWTTRSGWRMRGVPDPESVAEHGYGVALTALAMADVLRAEAGITLDVGRLLSIALLHDLAEARLTDLPVSAVRLLGNEAKRQAELGALAPMLAPLPSSQQWVALWLEFEDATSPEGRLVRDADKVEMMVQCLRYERAGCRGLDEFWRAMDLQCWYYPLSAQLYERLKAIRQAEG